MSDGLVRPDPFSGQCVQDNHGVCIGNILLPIDTISIIARTACGQKDPPIADVDRNRRPCICRAGNFADVGGDGIPRPYLPAADGIEPADNAIKRVPLMIVPDCAADNHNIFVDCGRRSVGDLPHPLIVKRRHVDPPAITERSAGLAAIGVERQQDCVLGGKEDALAAFRTSFGPVSGLPVGNAPAIVLLVHIAG